jgi:hypothetical protein
VAINILKKSQTCDPSTQKAPGFLYSKTLPENNKRRERQRERGAGEGGKEKQEIEEHFTKSEFTFSC